MLTSFLHPCLPNFYELFSACGRWSCVFDKFGQVRKLLCIKCHRMGDLNRSTYISKIQQSSPKKKGWAWEGDSSNCGSILWATYMKMITHTKPTCTNLVGMLWSDIAESLWKEKIWGQYREPCRACAVSVKEWWKENNGYCQGAKLKSVVWMLGFWHLIKML